MLCSVGIAWEYRWQECKTQALKKQSSYYIFIYDVLAQLFLHIHTPITSRYGLCASFGGVLLRAEITGIAADASTCMYVRVCVFNAEGLKGGDPKHRPSLERSPRRQLFPPGCHGRNILVYGEDCRNPHWQRLGEGPTGSWGAWGAWGAWDVDLHTGKLSETRIVPSCVSMGFEYGLIKVHLESPRLFNNTC